MSSSRLARSQLLEVRGAPSAAVHRLPGTALQPEVDVQERGPRGRHRRRRDEVFGPHHRRRHASTWSVSPAGSAAVSGRSPTRSMASPSPSGPTTSNRNHHRAAQRRPPGGDPAVRRDPSGGTAHPGSPGCDPRDARVPRHARRRGQVRPPVVSHGPSKCSRITASGVRGRGDELRKQLKQHSGIDLPGGMRVFRYAMATCRKLGLLVSDGTLDVFPFDDLHDPASDFARAVVAVFGKTSPLAGQQRSARRRLRGTPGPPTVTQDPPAAACRNSARRRPEVPTAPTTSPACRARVLRSSSIPWTRGRSRTTR
jgi:hypothetical protein